MSRATERFAREAAAEIAEIHQAKSAAEQLARGRVLTGEQARTYLDGQVAIEAREEALRARYFPRAASLHVSRWFGEVVTVSPTGRTRAVYVPARLAPRDRVRIAAPGDAMFGALGVVESVSTHAPTRRQYADVRIDDGSRATWPADELEHVDAAHVADCLCSPCEDARWTSTAVPA